MIGVFDSGSGGLTVLDALRKAFPRHDFLYLGDHARAPYGTRSAEEVHRFTREAVAFLIGRGARLILIACNTAAAVALRALQQDWLPQHAPDVRVLGVHVPLVEHLTGQHWNSPTPSGNKGAIAIFATPRTVLSNAFPTEIGLRAPELRVFQQSCPGLAEAIEAHVPDATLDELVRGHVAALMAQKDAQTIGIAALACTHYPFAYQAFRKALPGRIAIATQPDLVVSAFGSYLARHPEMDRQGSGHVELLTTGDPVRLSGLQSRLPETLRNFTGTESLGGVGLPRTALERM